MYVLFVYPIVERIRARLLDRVGERGDVDGGFGEPRVVYFVAHGKVDDAALVHMTVEACVPLRIEGRLELNVLELNALLACCCGRGGGGGCCCCSLCRHFSYGRHIRGGCCGDH